MSDLWAATLFRISMWRYCGQSVVGWGQDSIIQDKKYYSNNTCSKTHRQLCRFSALLLRIWVRDWYAFLKVSCSLSAEEERERAWSNDNGHDHALEDAEDACMSKAGRWYWRAAGPPAMIVGYCSVYTCGGGLHLRLWRNHVWACTDYIYTCGTKMWVLMMFKRIERLSMPNTASNFKVAKELC